MNSQVHIQGHLNPIFLISKAATGGGGGWGERGQHVLVLPDPAALAYPSSVSQLCLPLQPVFNSLSGDRPEPGSAPQPKELEQERACPGSGWSLPCPHLWGSESQ